MTAWSIRRSRQGPFAPQAVFHVSATSTVTVIFLCLVGLAVAQAADRGLLWHVIQACVANAKITGASFPCLDVDLSKGEQAGFAVVRAPLETTHVIVVPTTRVEGIESPLLQQADSGHYFQDAWFARRFVAERAPHPLGRDDIGLALNSLPGRSQDQLHIHVDCMQAGVRDALRKHAPNIKTDAWTKLPFALHGEHYWALRLKSTDLADVNVFHLVSDGLHVTDENRPGLTIVVAGATFAKGEEGFYLLAAVAAPGRHDQGHGEFLLNHACTGL